MWWKLARQTNHNKKSQTNENNQIYTKYTYKLFKILSNYKDKKNKLYILFLQIALSYTVLIIREISQLSFGKAVHPEGTSKERTVQ